MSAQHYRVGRVSGNTPIFLGFTESEWNKSRNHLVVRSIDFDRFMTPDPNVDSLLNRSPAVFRFLF